MTLLFPKYIDHTILKPEATSKQIKALCEEAIKYNFKAVCINPTHVKMAKEVLKDTEILICTVIGFPLGANTTEVKAFEMKDAIKNGADEIDMVINIGALKEENYDHVLNDIQAVKNATQGKLLKVIIETALLTNKEKEMACKLSLQAGAEYVKTSTGFSNGGASIHDVILMKNIVKDKALVKASGGIKDRDFANQLIEVGASRLGTSSGVSLLGDND